MAATDDGGRAFPGGELQVLDVMAAAALKGLLASGNDGGCGCVYDTQLNRPAAVYAKLAYDLAAAMVAERKRRQ